VPAPKFIHIGLQCKVGDYTTLQSCDLNFVVVL